MLISFLKIYVLAYYRSMSSSRKKIEKAFIDKYSPIIVKCNAIKEKDKCDKESNCRYTNECSLKADKYIEMLLRSAGVYDKYLKEGFTDDVWEKFNEYMKKLDVEIENALKGIVEIEGEIKGMNIDSKVVYPNVDFFFNKSVINAYKEDVEQNVSALYKQYLHNTHHVIDMIVPRLQLIQSLIKDIKQLKMSKSALDRTLMKDKLVQLSYLISQSGPMMNIFGKSPYKAVMPTIIKGGTSSCNGARTRGGSKKRSRKRSTSTKGGTQSVYI